jgi:hypothetical protein
LNHVLDFINACPAELSCVVTGLQVAQLHLQALVEDVVVKNPAGTTSIERKEISVRSFEVFMFNNWETLLGYWNGRRDRSSLGSGLL